MTTVKTPCPICGEPMSRYQDYDDMRLMEESDSCSKGHYAYQYEHGNTTVMVDGRIWEWSHLDTFQQIHRKTQEITAHEKSVKETYDKTQH